MPDEGFAGRVAAVFGGSGGIGRSIIHALQAAGAQTVSLDVVAPQPPDFPWITCDVRDDVSVASAVQQVLQKHERLDFAIYAAGVSSDAVLWKLSLEEWDRVLGVNLRGAFLALRHVIPAMRAGGGGRIVLIGSINGSRGKFGTSAYSASKAGLVGLARTAARELGRFGICVNVIEPGWVRTPLTERLPEKFRAEAERETLLGSLTEPKDIAAAVCFLCGSGGRRITGQILRVDAGQFLGGC